MQPGELRHRWYRKVGCGPGHDPVVRHTTIVCKKCAKTVEDWDDPDPAGHAQRTSRKMLGLVAVDLFMVVFLGLTAPGAQGITAWGSWVGLVMSLLGLPPSLRVAMFWRRRAAWWREQDPLWVAVVSRQNETAPSSP